MDKEIIKTHLEENSLFLNSYIGLILNRIQEVEYFFETTITDIFLNSKTEESGSSILSSIWLFDEKCGYEVHLENENNYSFDMIHLNRFMYTRIHKSIKTNIPETNITLNTAGTLNANFCARGIYRNKLDDIYKRILLPHLKNDI